MFTPLGFSSLDLSNMIYIFIASLYLTLSLSTIRDRERVNIPNLSFNITVHRVSIGHAFICENKYKGHVFSTYFVHCTLPIVFLCSPGTSLPSFRSFFIFHVTFCTGTGPMCPELEMKKCVLAY